MLINYYVEVIKLGTEGKKILSSSYMPCRTGNLTSSFLANINMGSKKCDNMNLTGILCK